MSQDTHVGYEQFQLLRLDLCLIGRLGLTFLLKTGYYLPMDEKYLNGKTIKTSIAQLAAFKQMGFTMSEVLLLLVILSLLDGANCLIINANSMADFFNISERHIYRTLHKTKEFGVVKNGKRYDFTALKETLDNLDKLE